MPGCFGPKHLAFSVTLSTSFAGGGRCVIRRGNYVNPKRMAQLRQRISQQSRLRRTSPFSTEVSLDAILANSRRTNTQTQWIKVHLRVNGRMDSPTGPGGGGTQWGWQAFRVDASELEMLIQRYQRQHTGTSGPTPNGVADFLMSFYTDMDIVTIDQIFVGPTGEQ